jgi:hypothetical protein
MQVTNNLQVPIEVQLLQPQDHFDEVRQGNARGTEEEEKKAHTAKHLLHRREDREFQMIIKPESSMIIPL